MNRQTLLVVWYQDWWTMMKVRTLRIAFKYMNLEKIIRHVWAITYRCHPSIGTKRSWSHLRRYLCDRWSARRCWNWEEMLKTHLCTTTSLCCPCIYEKLTKAVLHHHMYTHQTYHGYVNNIPPAEAIWTQAVGNLSWTTPICYTKELCSYKGLRFYHNNTFNYYLYKFKLGVYIYRNTLF